MLLTSITLTTVLVASPWVDVRSTTDCPSAQDIGERLRPLLPDGMEPRAAPDLATVTPDRNGKSATLRVHLVRGNGTEVGDRPVPLQGDCAQAAATIAAVIAAWETEPMAVTPSAASAIPAAAAPDTSPGTTWRAFVGVGGGVALWGGAAGLGRIEALVGTTSSRLMGRIGVIGETLRTISLSSGSVDWRRTSFEASLLLRTLHPTWSLSADAGFSLGWASLVGRGFAPNRQPRSLDYGGIGAVRLTRSLGRWAAWIEARGYLWLRTQRASLTDDETSRDLPPGDVSACAGMSIPLF